MVTVLGANTLSTGSYEVDNSLRFHSDTYLTNTFGSAPTLATKNTMSLWFKRSILGTLQQLMTGNNNAFSIVLNTNNTIAFYNSSGQLLGPRLYRDTSGWMHFVFAYDSTQGTAANRFKVYINGVEETSFSNTAYPDQDVASQLGVNGQVIEIGTRSNHDRIFEGYMAETAFVDGQALAADSFGEFDSDSGIWKPIDVSSLTFGNNGFYLENKQSGTSQNSSGMGADTSGNDFHFAVTNFTAVDPSTDTCTNNFATMNPLIPGQTNYTYSDGNLTITQGSAAWVKSNSTIGMSSGKWYWEGKWVSGNYTVFAVDNTDTAAPYSATSSSAVGYKRNGNVEIGTDPQTDIAAYAHGDIVSVALDMDNDAVYFYKNGAIQNSGDPTSGASKTGAYALPVTNSTYFANISPYGSGATTMNFGSPPYAISSSNADEDGFGNFEYAVPAGYFALCSKNLAEYG